MADDVLLEMLADLEHELEERHDDIEKEEGYYEGELPRIYLSDYSIPSYAQIVQQARTPWASLVVDVASERMRVEGFRVITPDTEDDDAEADSLAWDIWSHSGADVASQVAFREMLLHGRTYALVEDDGSGLALVTFESAESTAVLHAPGLRSTVAGVKRWHDKRRDADAAVLWTADSVTRLQRDRRSYGAGWIPVETAANLLGVVPLFEMRNQPDLEGGARSDLDGLYPALDRAVQTVADRLTAQTYSSTKIRFLIGVEPEVDADGNPTARTMRMAVDRLLLIENPDAKAGTFPETDLRPLIEAARADIACIASIARLPVHLLSGDLVNLSAEALKAISDGLAARVGQRQAWAGGALSQAMRLALKVAGDTRIDDPRTRVEPVWAPVLPEALSAMAQAANILVTSGVLSNTGAMEYALGMGPSEIEKMNNYRRSDLLDQQALQGISDLFAAPEPEPVPAQAEPAVVA
jgi:hypothetical protein